jgi:transcriptional regulator with XRE-family HTH domain
MKLAEYLKNTNLRQHEFADAIGCSRDQVRKMCTGNRLPSMRLVMAIREATNGYVTEHDFEYPVTPMKICPTCRQCVKQVGRNDEDGNYEPIPTVYTNQPIASGLAASNESSSPPNQFPLEKNPLEKNPLEPSLSEQSQSYQEPAYQQPTYQEENHPAFDPYNKNPRFFKSIVKKPPNKAGRPKGSGLKINKPKPILNGVDNVGTKDTNVGSPSKALDSPSKDVGSDYVRPDSDKQCGFW